MLIFILTLEKIEGEGITAQAVSIRSEQFEVWLSNTNINKSGNFYIVNQKFSSPEHTPFLKYLTQKDNFNYISLTIKGVGNYVVNVYVNRDNDYYYYRFPIELDGKMKTFKFELKDGIQMGFGMPKFPNSKLPSKIIITPSEPYNGIFNIEVSNPIIE